MEPIINEENLIAQEQVYDRANFFFYWFGSKNHEPLYSDPGHLNLKGSEFTAEFIYPKIKEMLAE